MWAVCPHANLFHWNNRSWKPVVRKRGTWAPLVAIVLGNSPFINTFTYTPIFASVNIHPGIPSFTSCLQLKGLTQKDYILFSGSWILGHPKEEPACCSPIFQSFLGVTVLGNYSNQLQSHKQHTQLWMFPCNKCHLQENNQWPHRIYWTEIFCLEEKNSVEVTWP